MKNPLFQTHDYHEKRLFWLYNLGFLALGFLATYFYEERIYGSDASSYLFGVVNTEWFYTERGRIVIWLSQCLPLLTVFLGLSMKSVLIAHSLGHVLFFYAVFLLGHFYFQRTYVGALMLVVQTLAVTDAYFAWPYGEVYYGVALVVLLIETLKHKAPFNYYPAIFIALICVFLITGHPLVFPCLGLSMVLLFFQTESRVKLFWAAAIMLFIAGFRFVFFPSYDGDLANKFFTLNSWSFPSADDYRSLIYAYYPLWISMVIVFVYLLVKNRLISVILFIASLLLISLVIIRFSSISGATQQYYQAYTGVFVVLVQIEVFGTVKRNKTAVFFSYLLLVAALISVYEICSVSGQIVAHIQRLKSLAKDLSAYDGNRFVIKGHNMYGDSTLIWQSSEPFHEMLLLSAAREKTILLRVFERGMEYHEWHVNGLNPVEGPEDPRSKRKVYHDNSSNRQLMADWLPTAEPEFNQKYFYVKPSSIYRFLNKSDTINLHNVQKLDIAYLLAPTINGQMLNVELCNNGSRIYSDAKNDVKLMIVSDGQSDTLIQPLTKDVIRCSTEIIFIPNTWCKKECKTYLVTKGKVIIELR
ncbi:MAG: hypothetical protein K9G41_09860 [Flavobacteriales bacterium]|nr:hypothetical protein [Flavobacteriales bacterium]